MILNEAYPMQLPCWNRESPEDRVDKRVFRSISLCFCHFILHTKINESPGVRKNLTVVSTANLHGSE